MSEAKYKRQQKKESQLSDPAPRFGPASQIEKRAQKLLGQHGQRSWLGLLFWSCYVSLLGGLGLYLLASGITGASSSTYRRGILLVVGTFMILSLIAATLFFFFLKRDGNHGLYANDEWSDFEDKNWSKDYQTNHEKQ